MFKTSFWNGIKVVVPIAVTIALLYWVLHAIDSFFSVILNLVLPQRFYFPGLGLIVGLIIVLIIGFAMNAWAARKVHELWEAILGRIPLVKTLYSAVKDILSFFDKEKQKDMGKVVAVHYNGYKTIGILTRDHFEGMPEGFAKEGEVAVFFPFSYQIGGITTIVSWEHVEILDLSVEKAMRFIVTAGMMATAPQKKNDPGQPKKA